MTYRSSLSCNTGFSHICLTSNLIVLFKNANSFSCQISNGNFVLPLNCWQSVFSRLRSNTTGLYGRTGVWKDLFSSPLFCNVSLHNPGRPHLESETDPAFRCSFRSDARRSRAGSPSLNSGW